MSIFQKSESYNKNYYPAILRNLNSIGWVIEYQAFHPQKKMMVRQRMKLNVLRKKYPKLADFKKHAIEICCQINAKLLGGWSPFMEQESIRLYTDIEVVVNEYLAEKEKELRKDTLRSYSSFCRIFLNWINENVPHVYASLFNKVLAVKYMDYIYITKKVSARTYNNQLKMARAFFNFAKEKCYVKENPFDTIKAKRTEQKKRTIIPAETRQIIIDYLQEHNPAFLTICRMVFTSLIRPKEIRMIQIKHINLHERYILIPSDNAKNHNQRYAPLNDDLINDLINMHLDKYDTNYYLFGIDYKPAKKSMPETKLSKEWVKVRAKLNLPENMQLYSLRDTGINNMLKAGIDPLTVMQAADHHDLKMTTRYANHADIHLIETINKKTPKF